MSPACERHEAPRASCGGCEDAARRFVLVSLARLRGPAPGPALGVTWREGNPAGAAVDRRDLVECAEHGEFVVDGHDEAVGLPFCWHVEAWLVERSDWTAGVYAALEAALVSSPPLLVSEL